MIASQTRRASMAAETIASSLGLPVRESLILSSSNALILRLLPCDVLARVSPVDHQVAALEVLVSRRLSESGCPVAALEPRVEPRVYERDGFAVTFWTFYESDDDSEPSPSEYADALQRLHAGMRGLDVPAPHFTSRVRSAQALVARPDLTPGLVDDDRTLLARALERGERIARAGRQQLLHGEPHPGNLLMTARGLRFIDFETCCIGPVEFDVAHAPEPVGDHYPNVDRDLLRECRILMLAMITAWRWDRDDQLPDGRRLAGEWLDRLRAALT